MSSRASALLVCASLLVGCITLPPTASLNPPTNSLGPVEKNAWLKRVEITDSEMGQPENKENLENTLTNNLLRFLRDGRYFKRMDLLPGKPQTEDYVLQFRFDRYRQTRTQKGFGYFVDASDLSATLTITHPDGQLVKEVKFDIKEEHGISSLEARALPSGMRARTQIVEELLRKALFAPSPIP